MRWRWPRPIDHFVLFSGDGDFRSLVEALQRKRQEGQRRLDPDHPAADDRRRAPPPGRPLLDLATLRAQIGRDPSERAQRQAERVQSPASFADEFEDDEAI